MGSLDVVQKPWDFYLNANHRGAVKIRVKRGLHALQTGMSPGVTGDGVEVHFDRSRNVSGVKKSWDFDREHGVVVQC
jgi:hypothetical protein